jgi:hypothetical protein
MKKTYIRPKTAIVNVVLQQMIAASVEDGFSKSGVEELPTEIISGNASRRSTLWDDEDTE